MIRAINSEQFLERIANAANYKVKKDALDVLFARVRFGLPIWDFTRRRKLRRLYQSWREFVGEE